MSLLSKYLSADECRMKAVELRATAVTSPTEADSLKETAAIWDLIANELEAKEGKPPSPRALHTA